MRIGLVIVFFSFLEDTREDIEGDSDIARLLLLDIHLNGVSQGLQDRQVDQHVHLGHRRSPYYLIASYVNILPDIWILIGQMLYKLGLEP